jgi:hypothetical protein
MFYLMGIISGGVGISQSNEETTWGQVTSATFWVYFIYNSYWTLIYTWFYFTVVTILTLVDRFGIPANVTISNSNMSFTRAAYSHRIQPALRYRIEMWTWISLELMSTAQLAICIAYWAAYISSITGLLPGSFTTSFIQGSAHSAGFVFLCVELVIGARPWVLSHVVIVLWYAVLWLLVDLLLYTATDIATYTIQDPTVVPVALACSFAFVFAVAYAFVYLVLFAVNKWTMKIVSKIRRIRMPKVVGV